MSAIYQNLHPRTVIRKWLKWLRLSFTYLAYLNPVFTLGVTLGFSNANAQEWIQTPYNILQDPLIKQSLTARLKFVAGLKLESKNDAATKATKNTKTTAKTWGGFSALVIRPKQQLVAFSDRNGLVLTAKWALEKNKISLQNIRMDTITNASGQPLADIESVAVVKNQYYIGLDNSSHIYRYDPQLTFIDIYHTLEDYQQLPNAGIETLTAWPDGSLLAIAEKQTGEKIDVSPFKSRKAWFILANNTSLSKTYLTLGPRNPTAATTLDNGSIVILERAYVSGRNLLRLVLLEQQQIISDPVLKGQELADIIPSDDMPNSLDNGEALGQFTQAGQQYLVLMTDNNLRSQQKTLLLVFRLDEPSSTPHPAFTPQKNR